MIRSLLLLAAVLAIAACGNEPETDTDTDIDTDAIADTVIDAGPGDAVAAYEQAMEAQRELVTEITGVLEGVTDEESAAAAAPRIEELSGELQRLAARINAMPQLPYAEQRRITQERAGSAAARRAAGKQMLKVEQYPVLKEAWSRGMRGAGD
ncbi:hypothetical protein [Lentisalinibacter orientalis]|uniref:hypothetical protein n=1 Tax=Lentisalinibacter orientalis TaxID=2992241 RepID=UPI003870331C